MELPWWMYLKDVVLLGGLIWVIVIYRNHAKTTEKELKSLQENQTALLNQANTLKAHIESNLQLLDRLKSEEMLKHVENTEKIYAKVMETKIKYVEQELASERDEALKGKTTSEERLKSLKAVTQAILVQTREAFVQLGLALYYMPGTYRTAQLRMMKEGITKEVACEALREIERLLGPSPADRPYYELSLALALELTAPPHTNAPEPEQVPEPPSDTRGMTQAPQEPKD